MNHKSSMGYGVFYMNGCVGSEVGDRWAPGLTFTIS